MIRASLLVLAGCASAPRPAPPPSPPPAAPAPIAAACDSPEHHQLDFWLGDWDVVVKARKAPASEEWGTARGHQHVERILGGCAIQETFSAEAPVKFAGRSLSVWVQAVAGWRQTWVDDSGGYLAFRGGPDGDTFVLAGEPREVNGQTVQMRMVFSAIAKDSLRWEWQRTTDAWATSTVMMAIDYRRR